MKPHDVSTCSNGEVKKAEQCSLEVTISPPENWSSVLIVYVIFTNLVFSLQSCFWTER
jgi:hypothetical protein